MSGLEPWPSAVCQARVWALPDADSFLTEQTLAQPCVPALDLATEGRKRPGTLQTGESQNWSPLQTRCLTWGSAPYAAGEAASSSFPPRLRTHSTVSSGPVSHRASSDTSVCPVELQNHPFSL